MPEIIIRDLLPEDEYFVRTCSHVNESEETDAAGMRRVAILREQIARGGIVKVALYGRDHVGFAHGVPIERSSWGPVGTNLMVVPCLYVLQKAGKLGIGRALMQSIEDEAMDAGKSGIALMAFRDAPGAEWLLPAAFFERLGYVEVDHRSHYVLLWKPFSESAEEPLFLDPSYDFQSVPGKVVVDLFFNDFCQTSSIEAQRVREVAVEFGDRVVLNEYCADDHNMLLSCGISRAIYVNGKEIGWGYEAPKDGIRKAIENALDSSS